MNTLFTKFGAIFGLLALSIYTCPNRDTLCRECAGSSCVTCMNSFSNSSGNCSKSISIIQFCKIYKSQGRCLECDEGYKVSSSFTCTSIGIDNCAKADLNGNCKSCYDGRLVTQDGSSCTSDYCSVSNCSRCSWERETQICNSCNQDYSLYSTSQGSQRCVVQTPLIKNCEQLISNQGALCLRCEYGYYLKNGYCTKSFNI